MPVSIRRRCLLYLSQRPCPGELREHLERRGWELLQASNLRAAQNLLAKQALRVGLLVLDGWPSALAQEFSAGAPVGDCEWLAVVPRGAMQNPQLREVMLAHFFDYHTDPVDPQFLCAALGHAWGRAELRAGHGAAPAPAAAEDELGMVGRSPAVAALRRMIRRAAPTDAAVLIGGESGSGKELVARAVHASSGRADAPFMAVNCGALAPSLIHAELFGHERGAFSGASTQRRGLIEAAHGGTLFLDEIAELPLDLQATLLRFLQEKAIHRVGATQPVHADVRVIAATHVDLQSAVAAGRFREDLFYRINVLHLRVPALRERNEDIPLLARHFLQHHAHEGDSRIKGFSTAAMDALCAHDWPGNVRELSNRIQRAVVMADPPLVGPVDLGLACASAHRRTSLHSVRLEAEHSAIRMCLERLGNNVALAARELGISRMTLYRLLDKHGIAHRDGDGAAAGEPTPRRLGSAPVWADFRDSRSASLFS